MGGVSVCTNPTHNELVTNIETSMPFFPPGEDESTISALYPLRVYVGMAHLKILSVDQETRSFTAAYQTDMYWYNEDCIQSNVLKSACAARLGTWYFVEPGDAIGTSDLVSAYTVLASDTAGALISFGSGCTNGDFLSVQTTFAHLYDMTYYPFEAHELTIKLQSRLTTESINITAVGLEPDTGDFSVPGSWTIERGWLCHSSTFIATEAARGGIEQSYAYVECSIIISKIDDSWFLNSFVLFVTIVLTNLFLSLSSNDQPLSSITGAPVDPRELPLMLGQRAATTTGLVLAYIFAIEYKPYGKALGFFTGGMPLSFVTYFTGLAALAISGLWTAAASYVALVKIRGPNVSKVLPATGVQTRDQAVEKAGAEESDETREIARAAAFRRRLSGIDFCVISVVHVVAVVLPVVYIVRAAVMYTDDVMT